MKIRRTTRVLLIAFVGYVVTWLFAPPLARTACESHAARLYAEAVADQEKMKKVAVEIGRDPEALRPIVGSDSPQVKTGFVIPILPGILLMNNSYVVGPLYGKGQVTFFLYYGFGICRLFEITTWIS